MELLQPESHIKGELIASSHPDAYADLIQVLQGLRIEECLNPFEPYKEGRGGVPKAQAFKAAGAGFLAPRPISQVLMNSRIADGLRSRGWAEQPLVDRRALMLEAAHKPTLLKGDFFKDRVLVEVEFGNAASFYRNLFKFQVAQRAGTADVAVLVMASRRTASLFDSGVTTFENGRSKLPYINFIGSMPILMLGIQPESFEPVERRYREMVLTLEANDKKAASWERYQRRYLK